MHKPEVLAPVGDIQVLQAALKAGADAVYFGLSEGFNARARAQNITLASLPEVMETIHAAGAKAYVTVNTLVFQKEIPALIELLKALENCKVDSFIIQDLGAARLAAEYAPSVRLHASTQMTLSDIYAVKWAKNLGFRRTVMARELSSGEIADITAGTDCELEIFALGALCVSFSGQCLASLAWGGRSANRGQCAQPCRLPFRYTSLPHGQELNFTDGSCRLSPAAHLMSPCDLAGFEQIGNLIKAGASSLKIEGRLKGESYVYMAVKTMRNWVDAHFDEEGRFRSPAAASELELRRNLSDLSITFSRGFTPGFLSHFDHQNFVQKGYPKHRGQLLGTVASKEGHSVKVSLLSVNDDPRKMAEEASRSSYFAANKNLQRRRVNRENIHERRNLNAYPVTPQNGMGVLFLSPNPEDNNSEHVQGGPIFSCTADREACTLRFGNPGPDLSKVRKGDLVYISGAPQTAKRISQALNEPISGRLPMHIRLEGQEGLPLTVTASVDGLENTFSVCSQSMLSPAQKRSLNAETAAEKFAELSGTPIHLEDCDGSGLQEGLFLPLSELKPMRRTLVEKIEKALQNWKTATHNTEEKKQNAEICPFSALPAGTPLAESDRRSCLSVLCRTAEQVRTALDMGIELIELEAFRPDSISSLANLVREKPEVSLHLAAPRIQKNGDERILEKLLELEPDGMLLRSIGSLEYLREEKAKGRKIPALHGDFSFNITNSYSADLFIRLGLSSFTASDDLDEEHLTALTAELQKMQKADRNGIFPADRMVVTLYRRLPAFHTQHCLYANLLTDGMDSRTCGQPCFKNDLYLVDRRQFAHPVRTDALCRNTVFSQTPVQRQKMLPALTKLGVINYRVELMDETAARTRSILSYYTKLF